MKRQQRTREQMIAAIERAIEELILQQRPFSQQEVLDLACVGSGGWLNRNPDIHEQVKAAVAASRDCNPPDPVKELENIALSEITQSPTLKLNEPEDPRLAKLQGKVAELEERNRELRSLLQQNQVQPVDNFALLKEQRDRWTEEASKLIKEIKLKEAELKRVQGNIKACLLVLDEQTESQVWEVME